MRKTLLVLCLLAGVVLAAGVVRTALPFKNGTNGGATHILSGATDACTTISVSVTTTPFLALYYNAYTLGSADSARFNVWYQWASDTSHFVEREDTVHLTNTGAVADTFRHLATRWGYEFYPPVATHLRFIFKGITGNSDSAYIDSGYLVGQTIN